MKDFDPNSDEILVMDNIMPKYFEDRMEGMFTSSWFPWYYNPTTYKGDGSSALDSINKETSNWKDTPQLVHALWSQEGETSNWHNDVMPLLSAIPYKFTDILRIKANFTTRTIECGNDSIQIPHIDFKDIPNTITALYYVVDSDGDTYFFEGTKLDNLKVTKTVTPKKGRMVIFNGNMYHASNTPRNFDKRIVVNFNVLAALTNPCL
jgi:hypothetical protein